MRKGIKIFLEKLKFVKNYQRFCSKIRRFRPYCVLRDAYCVVFLVSFGVFGHTFSQSKLLRKARPYPPDSQ